MEENHYLLFAMGKESTFDERLRGWTLRHSLSESFNTTPGLILGESRSKLFFFNFEQPFCHLKRI